MVSPVNNQIRIAHIISANTELGIDEIRTFFLHGEAKNLDFALEKGIIQEIREAGIPSNAQLLSCNFN